MKKVFRITACATILSIVFSMLAGCSFGKDNNDVTETTNANSDDIMSTSEYTSQDITSETNNSTVTLSDTSEANTSKSEDKTADDDVNTMLKLISNYPQGTAGSTAKCVDISIRLINFTQANVQSSESLKKVINDYLSGLSNKSMKQFGYNLEEIDYVARKLISGDTTSLNSYINDSKEKYNKGSYDINKYEAVYNLISN